MAAAYAPSARSVTFNLLAMCYRNPGTIQAAPPFGNLRFRLRN